MMTLEPAPASEGTTSVGGVNASASPPASPSAAAGQAAAPAAADLPQVGDRVARILTKEEGGDWKQQETAGSVAYVGQTQFAEGTWIGIRLDKKDGKNDGRVQDKRYFECEPNQGIFVKPACVTLESQLSAGQQDAAGTNPRRESLYSGSSLNTGASMNTVRRHLAEASENHDAMKISALLARAERAGVTSTEIESARKIMQYELEVAMEKRRMKRPIRESTIEMEVPILVDDGMGSERLPGGAPHIMNSEDLVQQLAQLRSRQDEWFQKLEARIAGLERGGRGVGGAAEGAAASTAAHDMPDDLLGRVRVLTDAVQGIEARLRQHEASMLELARALEASSLLRGAACSRESTVPGASRAVDGHIDMAALEEHISTLWSTIFGEPLRGQDPKAGGRMSSLEGRLATLWECILGEEVTLVALDGLRGRSGARGLIARSREEPAAGPPGASAAKATHDSRQQVLSLSDLQSAFSRYDPRGEDSVASERLADIFRDLGFHVRSSEDLVAVVDPQGLGAIKFEDFISAFQTLSNPPPPSLAACTSPEQIEAPSPTHQGPQ